MADLKAFQRYGDEIDSAASWEEMTEGYVDKLENRYHKHRLEVVKNLVPGELCQPGKRIFDFGCGDAVLFPHFIKNGAHVSGIDIAANMIALARTRLSELDYNPETVSLGGVNDLVKQQTGSFDAVLSFNVLAYLTDAEESLFYKEAYRLLDKGGYLIVTHSNELFDLFSQNSYTTAFLKKLVAPIYKEQVNSLAGREEKAVVTYNIRENPLAYKYKLAGYGFEELRQEFINWHEAPPGLLKGERNYPDTLSLPEQEKWKLMFTCSMFGSLSKKVGAG